MTQLFTNMDNQIATVRKDAETFIVLGKGLTEQANALEIIDDSRVLTATEILKQCQKAEKEIEDTRISIVKQPNDFVKMVNQLFKETEQPILQAKATIKTKIVKYNEELEKKKREAEEKRLAEERARLAKLEEERKEREEAERKIREAEEAKLAEERKKLSAEQAKLEEEKLQLEREKRLLAEEKAREEEEAKLAEEKKAKEIEEARLMAEKVKGISKRWTFEYVDENAVPRAYCSPDPVKIRAAIKAGVRTIGGLRVYEDTSVK